MALDAYALGPHEVLVLANGKSADSVEIARKFVELRSVPEQNLVLLNLPASVTNEAARISRDDFTNLIWVPANKAARDRKIADHILAWVYSTDFPTTVASDPALSLQGMTFVRNVPPEAEKTLKGTYVSPLFGIGSKEVYMPRTFDSFTGILGDDMPLPSMMLGYTGIRGNIKEVVIKCIERGVESDFTAPAGLVYFVTSDDVRSKCRDWQFAAAQKELTGLGVQSLITPKFPAKAPRVMGLMMGSTEASPGADNVYLPGSMAEHLTSSAGVFAAADQTKLSVWIQAGAGASCGTVVEPMSIWQKFPHARFFVYYASGCTMMESFFQSVRSPMELLVVGEPLAQPWAKRAEVVIKGISKEVPKGKMEVDAEVVSKAGERFGSFVYLVDGQLAGKERKLTLDTAGMSEGAHTLRCVAYRTGSVRTQVFKEEKFTVAKGAARQ